MLQLARAWINILHVAPGNALQPRFPEYALKYSSGIFSILRRAGRFRAWRISYDTRNTKYHRGTYVLRYVLRYIEESSRYICHLVSDCIFPRQIPDTALVRQFIPFIISYTPLFQRDSILIFGRVIVAD